MKEAAGEANMTVITIVLIAIVLGVGTIIVTNLMNSTSKKSACSEIGGTLSGSTCTFSDGKSCTMEACTGTNKGSYKCGTYLYCNR